MNTKTKLYLGMFGVGLAAIGVNIVHQLYFQDPKAVVFAPPNQSVTASIDGGPTVNIAPGKHHFFTVSIGEHTLDAEVNGAPVKRSFTTKTGKSLVNVPPVAEQCTVELDLSSSHYTIAQSEERDASQRPLPYLAFRKRVKAAYNFPNTHYLSEASIPKSKPQGVGVYLFQVVDCKLLKLDNNALVRALGFRGTNRDYADG